jgi:hypothetical protein
MTSSKPGSESCDRPSERGLFGSRRGVGLTEIVEVRDAVEHIGINPLAGRSQDLDELETCSPQFPALLRHADVIERQIKAVSTITDLCPAGLVDGIEVQSTGRHQQAQARRHRTDDAIEAPD